MLKTDSTEAFTYKIPEMIRGIEKESDFVKTGYAHCMKPSELIQVISNINSSDKKYCIYPNTFEVGRWSDKLGNNTRIINPVEYKDYEIDSDNTLFARISKIAQVLKEAGFNHSAIFSFITDNVSDFDDLRKCITYIFKYEVNKCNKSNAYLIMEYLIPFKINDYEMTSYTIEGSDYLSTLYNSFLIESANEDYEAASKHFYEFGKSMNLPDELIERVWKDYLGDAEFKPIKEIVNMKSYKKIISNNIKIDSSDADIIKKIDKNEILDLMKDFCDFNGNIYTELSSEDTMALMSQNIHLTTAENSNEDIFIIGEVENGKQYILFKTDKSKSYVFGYDIKEPDKLLMIKLNYKKDDFKFIEK